MNKRNLTTLTKKMLNFFSPGRQDAVVKEKMEPEKDHRQKNNEKLSALKDIHKGRRGFIIGNGPSLRMEDLDKLVNEITFASNRIYLAFPRTRWRPTYYTMCDEVVGKNNRETVLDLELTKVFANSVRPIFKDDPRAIFLNPKSSKQSAPETIGWDLYRGENAGHSVVNLGIKVAFWVGIRELYVIGMDHNFTVPDTKTGEMVANNYVIVSQGERNHFHQDYRKPGETWTIPKLDVMAEEFEYARYVLEKNGGSIKNASRFSKLDVWERVNFDDLF
ncbi:MAG: DUF115 domain-containing protein [bacterium]|nr:DUF115 domain-containing protein [bacterium]